MNIDYPEWSTLQLLAVLTVSVLISSILYKVWKYIRWRARHRYIGFGWVLRCEKESGNVFVATRLLASPAGWAGVGVGDQLLSWRDQSYTDLSPDEFAEHCINTAAYVGEVRSYRLKRTHTGEVYTVTMVAQGIQGPIPIYSTPPEQVFCDYRYKVGFAVCTKTGVLVQPVTLSDEYISELLNH